MVSSELDREINRVGTGGTQRFIDVEKDNLIS